MKEKELSNILNLENNQEYKSIQQKILDNKLKIQKLKEQISLLEKSTKNHELKIQKLENQIMKDYLLSIKTQS